MLKVLIIDDDPDLLVLLKTYLEEDKVMIIETADSYATGSAAIKQCAHDVYIIDYELNNQATGLELIQEAHKLGLAPLIMLTSVNDDRLAESVIASGGCDYICKMNLNMDHFYRAILNNISRANRINDLKEERSSLIRKSYFDGLTGLVNRAYVEEELSQPQINGNNSSSSVLFLDLDGFKNINDEHGHEAGDEVLKQVAERLVNSVQEHDVVARLGGDEFLIFMQPNEDRSNNDIVTSIISSRIIRAIAQPYKIHLEGSNTHAKVSITVSIGIALYPDHSSDLKDLIKLADQSMYKAKSRGKNQFVFYHPPLPEEPLKQSNKVTSGQPA
jgi:diguanylate cyclase (GGDEF) domain